MNETGIQTDLCIFELGKPGVSAAKVLQYLHHLTLTAIAIVRKRPGVIVVTAPPVPAVALVAAVARLTRSRVVIDAHPGAFGLHGDEVSARLGHLLSWALRRTAGVMVTTESMSIKASSLGARSPMVFHELCVPAMVRSPGDLVVIPFSGAKDEPLELALDVAALVPNLDVAITGNWDARPADLPVNARFTGYLGKAAFRDLLRRASVSLCLTEDHESVMRTIYDSLTVGSLPLISDTSANQALFPAALLVKNDPDSIAMQLRAITALPDDEVNQIFSDICMTVNERRVSQFQELKNLLLVDRP